MEQARELFGIHADAGVDDTELEGRGPLPGHFAHGEGEGAVVGEFGGVAEEVDQDLLQPYGVGGEGKQAFGDVQEEAVAVADDGGVDGRLHFAAERGDIDRGGRNLQDACVDPGEVEDVVDEVEVESFLVFSNEILKFNFRKFLS